MTGVLFVAVYVLAIDFLTRLWYNVIMTRFWSLPGEYIERKVMLMAFLERLFKDRRLTLEQYNGVIGAVLIEGLLLSALLAKMLGGIFSLLSPLALVIGYLIICIIGIIITHRSDRPLISFFGYNLVVVPTGILLSVLLRGVKTDLIIHALLITAGVVLVMIGAAQLRPRIFLKMGRALGVALIAVIIIEIIAAFAGWFKAGWWDAIVAALFALYIGYDWAKAQSNELTLDGAIDSCLDLYLDIVNLFIRILSALKSDD